MTSAWLALGYKCISTHDVTPCQHQVADTSLNLCIALEAIVSLATPVSFSQNLAHTPIGNGTECTA